MLTLAIVNFWVTEDWIPESALGWLVLVPPALISHAAGPGLVAYALVRLPDSFAAVTTLSEPVFATLAAWLMLAEAVTPLQAAGGAVIPFGIVLARPGEGVVRPTRCGRSQVREVK